MKELGERPSKILGISRLSKRLNGLKGRDEWTCYQFDQAIVWLGRYVENKLHELDDDGKPLYTLAQLLGDKPVWKMTEEKAIQFFAQAGIRVIEG